MTSNRMVLGLAGSDPCFPQSRSRPFWLFKQYSEHRSSPMITQCHDQNFQEGAKPRCHHFCRSRWGRLLLSASWSPLCVCQPASEGLTWSWRAPLYQRCPDPPGPACIWSPGPWWSLLPRLGNQEALLMSKKLPREGTVWGRGAPGRGEEGCGRGGGPCPQRQGTVLAS